MHVSLRVHAPGFGHFRTQIALASVCRFGLTAGGMGARLGMGYIITRRTVTRVRMILTCNV